MKSIKVKDSMDVNQLINHLKQCPPAFLRKKVNTFALLADTVRKLSGEYETDSSIVLEQKALHSLEQNHLMTLKICCWLLSHEQFTTPQPHLKQLQRRMLKQLEPLAKIVPYEKWVSDEERAEELIRLLLNWLQIIPDWETKEEAADRFSALSTIKRQEVLAKSNAAHQRMIEIKRKMAEKKAREAANLYGRE